MSRHSHRRLRQGRAIALMATAGIALSLFAYGLVAQMDQRRQAQHFAQRAAPIPLLLQNRMDRIDENLANLRQLFESSNRVDGDEFAHFVEPLLRHYPEIRAVGWAERRDGGRFPFVYRLPAGAEPVFRELDAPPRVGNGPATSSHTTLLQDALARNLLRLVEPVSKTVAGQSRSVGLVSVLVDLGELAEAAVDRLDVDDLHILVDGRPDSKGILYRHWPDVEGMLPDQPAQALLAQPPGGLQRQYHFTAGDRQWTLHVLASEQYLAANAAGQAQPVLIAGLLLSALLTLYLGALLRRTSRVEAEVEQRTAELSAERAYLSTTLATMADALIVTDEQGLVQSLNPATEQLFGYPREALIGENVKCLVGPPHHERHDGYLARYRESGIPHVLGKRTEVPARHSDGSEVPIELSVQEMHVDGRRLFLATCRDIRERREVERLKDAFIATVSHEIRTPLTAIRGAVLLINGGTCGELPAKAAGLLGVAQNNCDRLLRLVENLLDMDQLSHGERTEGTIETLSVSELLHQAVQHKGAEAAEQGLVLEASGGDGLSVRGNRAQLLKVLNNLLENAISASPAGAHIGLSARREGERIVLGVRDHGPGIPASLGPKLFEPFTQGDNSDTRQVGGSGLGLSISKAIVEQHGGRLSYRNEDDGGCTFVVELPQATVDDAHHAA